jgi:hypothetical protein
MMVVPQLEYPKQELRTSAVFSSLEMTESKVIDPDLPVELGLATTTDVVDTSLVTAAVVVELTTALDTGGGGTSDVLAICLLS